VVAEFSRHLPVGHFVEYESCSNSDKGYWYGFSEAYEVEHAVAYNQGECEAEGEPGYYQVVPFSAVHYCLLRRKKNLNSYNKGSFFAEFWCFVFILSQMASFVWVFCMIRGRRFLLN